MSGRIRSANAVVSDWKASQTTRNGILYSPRSSPLVGEHLAHLRRVHRRVPRHVGHEQEQRVDRVGVAAPGVGDDVVHQAVRRQRVFPGEALVDAHRLAVLVDEEIVGAFRPAQRRAVERRVRLDRLAAPWAGARWAAPRAGTGALWRKPPGRSMVPSSDIRIASVRIVWKPLECAARPRIAWKATGLPVTVSCFLPQQSVQAIGSSILLVARGDAHLVGEAADRRRRDAGDAGGPLGRVGGRRAPGQQLERGLRPACRRAATKSPSSAGSAPSVWSATALLAEAVPPVGSCAGAAG